MMKNLLLETRKHLTHGLNQLSASILISKAQGSYVYDCISKKNILDFTSGIGVVNAGHCHPKVVLAAQKQCAELIHAQIGIATHQPLAFLIQKLLPLFPAPLDTFFFKTSGAEAVEESIRIARHATGKNNIIVFQGGYHGRTIGTMSLTTSKTVYRRGAGSGMPNVFVAPFPYHHHMPWFKTPKECEDFCLSEFRLLLKQQTDPLDTAALIIEPILGEGGYVLPTDGFLHELKQICVNNSILFIADEVQTGFGRTGGMFSFSHFNLLPDIVVFAKGLANGFPLSGVVSSRSLMDKQPPGSMGGTYAGNAVACAAACATIDVLINENMLDNAVVRGNETRAALMKIHHQFPSVVSDVRGLGLMNAIEFHPSHRGIANRVSRVCADNGLLILTASAFETIRLIPPLNITASDLTAGMEILERAIDQVISSDAATA